MGLCRLMRHGPICLHKFFLLSLSPSFFIQLVLKIGIPLRIKNFFPQCCLPPLRQGEDMRLRYALSRNRIILSVEPTPTLLPLQGGLSERFSRTKRFSTSTGIAVGPPAILWASSPISSITASKRLMEFSLFITRRLSQADCRISIIRWAYSFAKSGLAAINSIGW